jgi:hypothetical protein
LRLSEQTITKVQAILQFWMGIQPAKTMQQIVILVGGLEHDFFFHFIYGMSSFPVHMFQDGWNHQPG